MLHRLTVEPFAGIGIALVALAASALGGCSDDAPAHAQGGAHVCPPQVFALCSYAPCRPIPGDPTKALCDCDVFDDVAIGNKTCEERKPRPGPYGLTQVVSDFSLIEIPTLPLMTCPDGTVWTQCLDAPCFVDPTNSQKAACTCQVQTSQTVQTYGGNCDTATCATSFWSAATPAQVQAGIDAIAEYLGIPPPQNRVCPLDEGDTG
jgi:hypothetical protein